VPDRPTTCTLSLSADAELHEDGNVTIRVDDGELEQVLLVEELEANQPR